MLEKMKALLRKDWYVFLILFTEIVLGFVFYPLLPSRVPIHWDSAGHVNGYGSRFMGAFLSPLISIGIYLLFWVAPIIDPRAKNYEKFKGSYQMIKCLTILLILITQVCTLLVGVGVEISINLVVDIAVSVLFVLLGNVMPRFRFNYFVGIRTPWTLANEEVWRKTHRLAGPIWVVGGVAMMVLTVLSGRLEVIGTACVVIGMVAIPYLYSYLLFRQMGEEKK